MNNATLIRELAVARAEREHRAAGGTGDAPRELVEKHASAIVRDQLEAPVESPERGVRQSNGMQPLNGNLPDDKPVRTGGEVRSFTDTNGRRVRVFAKGQHLADHVENRDGLTRHDIGNALAAMVTGNIQAYGAELRAMGGGVNSAGGILLTDSVSATVIDLARNKARLFQLGATTIEMPTESVRVARLITDPAIGVVAENTAIPMNDAAFDSVNLYARKLACIVPVSRELLEDSANAGEILLQALANSMASTLDTLALTGGSGDGWLGLLNDPQIEETDSIGSPTWDDLLDGIGEIRDLNGEPNGILANPSLWTTLNKLKESTTNAYLRPPAALDNIAKADTLSVPSSMCLIGDFTKVMFGVRGGLVVETSTEAGDSFQKHQTYLKIAMRACSNIAQPHFHKLTGIS